MVVDCGKVFKGLWALVLWRWPEAVFGYSMELGHARTVIA